MTQPSTIDRLLAKIIATLRELEVAVDVTRKYADGSAAQLELRHQPANRRTAKHERRGRPAAQPELEQPAPPAQQRDRMHAVTQPKPTTRGERMRAKYPAGDPRYKRRPQAELEQPAPERPRTPQLAVIAEVAEQLRGKRNTHARENLNQLVRQAHAGGATNSELAAALQVTSARVSQILKAGSDAEA